MKIGYYPGCTLKSKAKNLEDSAIESMKKLGVEMVELERWNCCGAVYNLAEDDLIHFLAPVRDLIRARDQGFDTLVTLCSMCYNTLARANKMMKEDEVRRDALNNFMEEESNYAGEVKVVHLLTFLRDTIGWDKVREAVKYPLEDIKLAPYYGCTLTRPRDIEIDAASGPVIFKDLIEALGATYVDYPDSQTCCGSYQVLSNPESAYRTTAQIIGSAEKEGADALIMSCPLCEYTLAKKQGDARKLVPELNPMPVFYFTQLMGIAFGLHTDVLRLDLNSPESEAFIQEKGLMPWCDCQA